MLQRTTIIFETALQGRRRTHGPTIRIHKSLGYSRIRGSMKTRQSRGLFGNFDDVRRSHAEDFHDGVPRSTDTETIDSDDFAFSSDIFIP